MVGMERQIAALGRLGRTKRGRSIINDHREAILGLMLDPWAEFKPYPPLIIRMHLRPEDLR